MALPKWPRHTEWSREKKTIESSETEKEGEKTNCFRVVDQSAIEEEEEGPSPQSSPSLSSFVHFAVWAEFIRIWATAAERTFIRSDERDGKIRLLGHF